MHEVMPRLTFWLGFVRWLFKGWPLRVWSLVAAYDLVSAQFLPAEFVPPKLIALLKATNIPANVLGVALGLILVFSALEFAYQNRNKVETRPQPKIIKTPGAADISWFDYEHALQPCSSIQHDLQLAGHFCLRGTNKSKETIKVVNAYLRSLVTGETLQIFIDRPQVPAIGSELQPLVTFVAMAPFPNEDGYLANNSIHGLSLDALWRRFSHFEFVFETEKKLHRIEFNQNFVEYFLRDMESMKRGPGGERPASLATP